MPVGPAIIIYECPPNRTALLKFVIAFAPPLARIALAISSDGVGVEFAAWPPDGGATPTERGLARFVGVTLNPGDRIKASSSTTAGTVAGFGALLFGAPAP